MSLVSGKMNAEAEQLKLLAIAEICKDVKLEFDK